MYLVHHVRRRAFLGALMLIGSLTFALAADYPTKSIRMVIGQQAGTGADIFCRYFADQLSKLAGRPVLVENKVGAGGNLATQLVATSARDGHTLLFATSNSLTGNFYLYKDLPFALADFEPVAPVAKQAFALAVAAQSPVRSVSEFSTQLKSKPAAAVRYGAPTSFALAAAELYLQDLGLSATRVAYKNNNLAVSELAAGEIDFFFMGTTTASGPVSRGQIKLLAVSTPDRATGVDLPTMDEAGVSGFDLSAWFGVFAPTGTPEAIVGRLEGWLSEISRRSETSEFLRKGGAEPYLGGREELRKVTLVYNEKYRRLSESGRLPLASD